MSNRRIKKKQQTLTRAAPVAYPPGGAMMYVPVGQQQGILGQTFYGSKAGIPTGTMPLFTSGNPLPPQPGVNPGGQTIQWRYPIAWNTFAVDRSLGNAEKPSFEVLRRLAQTYDGCTLNERYWLDLVPRMRLEFRLKKMYVDQGAEIKNFQKEQAAFMRFWEQPDGVNDLHTWLRMALIEQTQIDELYLYKNRTRGGKLLGLQVTDGSQMKPLLDDWGRLPMAPQFAWQQYPWGIPGALYSSKMMIHYRETPAAYTPFGFSRVERIILRINQALRKEKKDLSHFTEGNIPQSFMEVPESLNWTPDQIDSYEQSWNALLAGNPQQQIRMKFLQPGMKYIAAEDYPLLTDFDLFLFKIACDSYGVPPTEHGFTEDSNRSTGESQEDMVYRRTIGPNAQSYELIMDRVNANDFPEELHGEMFEAHFTGYEEVEDEQKKATAISTYTGAGILGLTDAAKLGNLPVDPDAPPIGRVIVTKDGPVFLDDLATPEMRQAQAQATLAGYQMAANPPAPDEGGGTPSEDKDEPPPKSKPKQPVQRSAPRGEDALERVADVFAEIGEYLRSVRAASAPMVSAQGTCMCDTCSGNHGRAVDHPPPYHDGCDCQMVPKGSETHVTRPPPETETAAAGPGEDRRGTGNLAISRAADSDRLPGTDGPLAQNRAASGTEDDAHPKALAASVSGPGGHLPPSRSGWKLRW